MYMYMATCRKLSLAVCHISVNNMIKYLTLIESIDVKVALEEKQGRSNLELVCEEFVQEEKLKEQKRELKREKKRRKKNSVKAQQLLQQEQLKADNDAQQQPPTIDQKECHVSLLCIIFLQCA